MRLRETEIDFGDEDEADNDRANSASVDDGRSFEGSSSNARGDGSARALEMQRGAEPEKAVGAPQLEGGGPRAGAATTEVPDLLRQRLDGTPLDFVSRTSKSETSRQRDIEQAGDVARALGDIGSPHLI